MTEIVVSVAAKVAEYLVAPVGRQCGYVIFTNSYVGQLKKELEKLDRVRAEVQSAVDAAENKMSKIKGEVNGWKNDAQHSADKARGVLNIDVRANKTCFWGCFPNPKKRYCLGRDATKTIKAIQALTSQKFETVSCESDPPGQVAGAPDVNSSAGDGGDTITDSRASIFQDIMKALDDEKLKVIGVYGPGGVGKTTLVEEVEKKLKNDEKRPFDMIVRAEVSQTPHLNKIQDDIAYFFGLKLKDEPSELGRKNLLYRRLRKNPSEKILIILDDLWDTLDLKAVGDPLGDESKGCKLLLISRFKDVLEQKMLANRTFRLEGLNDDEAFKLFEKTVGDKLKDKKLRQIALEVVKKGAGLPSFINSIASNLKDSNEYAWRNALKEIDESNMKTIKESYNHLESEDAKTLFLLCGLIGGTIQVEILLVLSVGLGLFEEFNDTIQESRDRLDTTLDKLRSACLLLDGGDDKGNVTIHDSYSEMVVSTPFGGEKFRMMNSNSGSWSKFMLEKCWAICQVHAISDGLAELRTCQFPYLKILMLSQPGDWCRLDFTCMKELRVLYLCFMTTLPSSIEFLGNLRSLYLDHCDVEDVTIIGKLKALQILSFVGSRISRLPEEIRELTNLRLLNLSNCKELQIIEPGVLERLIKVEELYMNGSFDRWMGSKDKIKLKSSNTKQLKLKLSNAKLAKLAELKSMTKLTSLEISIRDPIILLEDDYQSFENLDRFWINIGNVEGREFKGLKTMKLKLERCDGILSKMWVQKILQKTQYLHLDGLREFKSADDLCIRGFPQLKHLNIQNSPSIEYLVSSSHNLLTAFPSLESLFLENLIDLEKLCPNPIAKECFCKLKAVSVINCGQLKYLWCLSKKQGLVQLEEIKISACDSMQAIVMDDTREDEVVADDKVEFRNIRYLELEELPKMTSFCGRAEITPEGALIQVSLPNLENLKLDRVGSLTLGNCFKLLNVFSSTIIGSLLNLKEVIVWNCDYLESLFDCGFLDANMERKIVLLPKLEGVEIDGARRLRHVVKSDSPTVLGCPSLKYVSVENCSSMKYLFPNFTTTMLEQIESIYIRQCVHMKEVVPEEESTQSNAKEMSFPSLKNLCIWGCRDFEAFMSPTSVEKPLGEMAEVDDELPQAFFNKMVSFPNVTSLRIQGLKCKELWNDQIPADSFRKLGSLELKDCDNLQQIAPFHMWKRLQRTLWNLEVISCCSIEIIYEGYGMDTEGGKLSTLILHDLRNLRYIWQSEGLPNIPFPNLREVEAVRCPRLEMVFTTFTAKSLGQIEKLVVDSCENMEIIAGCEKWEEATRTAITFSKLTLLKLLNLPKFRGFLPEKLNFPSEDFPSLRVLKRLTCGAEPNQVLGHGEIHRQLRRQRRQFRRFL